MRKSILILAHNYGMQFLEGCNQYAQLFDPTLYHVTVAYLIGEENAEVQQKTQAETVLFFNFPPRSLRGIKLGAIGKLLTLCRKNQYEMVICHRYKPTYIMLLVNVFCHIPRLFFVMHAIETMRSKTRRALVACLFRSNMTFIGVSDAVRNDLRRDMWCVPPEKMRTFYNIMDHDLFAPALCDAQSARDYLHLPENQFIYGTIGRFVKEKDQRTLIQAYALIKNKAPLSKLVLAGSGKLEAELKEEARTLGLENEVIFTGFIPDGFRFMKAFQVFILNSVEEAFGRVLLEAMLAEVPIIATNTDGIPEVVGDTGYIVPKKDVHALAAIMLELYEMPAATLAERGRAGYQRMLNVFSPTPFKKQFWEIYSERGTP